MSFIIKFGGSLLFNDTTLDIRGSKVRELITILQSSKNISGVVCGGGEIARKYIHAGREMDFSEEVLDNLGIMVSRINAQLLIYAMEPSVYPNPITNLEEAKHAQSSNKIFVAGGFVPKQSTTTVAMQLCEALHCDLIVLTDVDGIFDKDPNKYPDALKYDKISYEEVETLLASRSGQEQTAGKYQIFDLLSLHILKRSNVRVRVIDGSDLSNLQILLSMDFISAKMGTIITK